MGGFFVTNSPKSKVLSCLVRSCSRPTPRQVANQEFFKPQVECCFVRMGHLDTNLYYHFVLKCQNIAIYFQMITKDGHLGQFTPFIESAILPFLFHLERYWGSCGLPGVEWPRGCGAPPGEMDPVLGICVLPTVPGHP